MTVRPVRRKEMGPMYPQGQAPSNEKPMPPQIPMQEQQPPMMGGQPAPADDQIQDHTHPEYDQMMVKMQEIEGELADMRMGGVNQENVEDTPEVDAKKNTEEPSDKFPISKEALRKLIREELQGVPERDVDKKQQTTDQAAQNVPQSTHAAPQPQGIAPSGGGFDSDDKTAKDEGDDTENKVPKPASEFDKPTVIKNKMQLAKKYIERAKKLMKEANGEEDPTEPMPGEVKKKPDQMEGQVANKNPVGGTEGLDIEVEDDDDDEEKDKPNAMQERSGRQSVVGMTAMTSADSLARQEQFLDVKERAAASVREYLQKAGHSRALNMMQ